jgi:hypothetical protein
MGIMCYKSVSAGSEEFMTIHKTVYVDLFEQGGLPRGVCRVRGSIPKELLEPTMRGMRGSR